MNRRANLARALASGYGLMVANAVYTLASVPIALSYLSQKEFGLWALVIQIGTYWTLIDLGMSGSILRTLIDHKDQKHHGMYGTVFKTGLAVGAAQGVLILVLSSALAPLVTSGFNVPAELRITFIKLLIAQGICLGLFQPSAVFSHTLIAHQRYDLANLAQLSSIITGLLTLWLSFRSGLGVFSLLWALIASSVTSSLATIAACLYLKLLPAKHDSGKVSGLVFRQLFGFGANLFLQGLGWQLVSASQVMIISRFVSLEAAATYVVCTKTFTLAQQFVWRVFDFSTAGLSEMAARSELVLLRERVRDLFLLTGSMSIFVGFITAACNQCFVSLWTHGEVGWNPLNDWLLGALTVTYSVNRIHGSVAWVMKRVEETRFLYVIEGLLFIALAFPAVKYLKIPGVLLASLVADCVVAGIYGLRRSAHSLQISAADLVRDGLKPAASYLLLFLPIAILVWALNLHRGLVSQFAANAIILTCLGALLFWTVGLNPGLRAIINGMLPWQRSQRVGRSGV